MEIGMLWFDNDPKVGLAEKIQRAAAYYRQKYGVAPNICFLHPSMLSPTLLKNETGVPALRSPLGNLELRPSKLVRPNYFWIGVNSKSSEGKSSD